MAATETVRRSGVARHIRYEELVASVPAAIAEIAAALGLQTTEAEIAQIHAETSPDRHADVMRKVAAAGPGSRRIETMRRVMHEDPVTLINDRHIQSGQAGRWRSELTPEEQDKVAARLQPWLAQYGFDS